jgi:hypothetical protein
VTLCCTPLFPEDVDLGDRARDTLIEHLFSATGEPPFIWRDLVLTSNLPPAIAPTLSSNGEFGWNSADSPLGSYSWQVTVSNVTGSAMASLTVRLVPDPGAVPLLSLAAIGVIVLIHRCR